MDNTESRMAQQSLSPMRNGARNGVWMAMAMIVTALASMYGDKVALLGLLSPLMMLGVPVLAFVLMRNDARRAGGLLTTGALWLDGVLSFICGAVIMSLVVYVLWRWVDPHWLSDRVDMTIDTLSGLPDAEAQDLARDLRKAVDAGLDLSARTMTMSLLWTASFSGCIASMVMAPIVKALTKNKT